MYFCCTACNGLVSFTKTDFTIRSAIAAFSRQFDGLL
jgi:hypothetical protein